MLIVSCAKNNSNVKIAQPRATTSPKHDSIKTTTQKPHKPIVNVENNDAATDGAFFPEKRIQRRRPYWNVWFEDKNKIVRQSELQTGKNYKFVLDLSAYDFSDLFINYISAAEAQRQLVDQISNAKGRVAIKLRPFTSGAFGKSTQYGDIDVVIDPSKFSKVREDEKEYHELAQLGIMDQRKFAEKVRAAWVLPTNLEKNSQRDPVSVILKTSLDPGCAAVGFSVWDETGSIPLDHVVYRTFVGERGSSLDGCLTDSSTAVFEAGFSTLITANLNHLDGNTKLVDGGLHFFEFAVTPKEIVSIVVFADARNPESVETYSWRTDVPLSKFFDVEMPDLIAEAQIEAAKENQNAYEYLAGRLRDRIFFDVEYSESPEAARAWEILQEFAVTGRSIKTRLVNGTGDTLYAPLGLLHAGGDNSPLKGRLSIVQALPHENHLPSNSCIREWSYMLPVAESAESEWSVMQDVNRNKPESGWLRNVFGFVDDDLRQYLRHQLGKFEMEETEPEGLLAVTHQSKGTFWFDKMSRKFLSEDIKRPYQHGSAAILATCEAAGTDYENRRALKRFNAQGMDLIIAAPFQVLLGYGAKLAKKMDGIIRETNEELDPNLDRRIVTLFEKAAQQVAMEDPTRQFDDMRHEFVVLGNPEIKLCLPDKVREIP